MATKDNLIEMLIELKNDLDPRFTGMKMALDRIIVAGRSDDPMPAKEPEPDPGPPPGQMNPPATAKPAKKEPTPEKVAPAPATPSGPESAGDDISDW